MPPSDPHPALSPPRLFVSITTHTTRHLAATLAALANQTRPPDAVAVSTDSDKPELADELDAWWPKIREHLHRRTGLAPTLFHSARPFQGHPRPNQTRNNGVRALLTNALAQPHDTVVFLDGDIALGPAALQQHADLAAAGAHLTIGYRATLDEPATAAIAPGQLISGDINPDRLVSPDELAQLRRRHARYRRNLFFSRLFPQRWGIIKPHKPKVISCHFALRLQPFLAINGFDEEYHGHHFDDDDLSRRLRLHQPRIPTRIAVASITAVHLFHPTRSFGRKEDDPNFHRWNRTDLPVRAAKGLDSPLPQPAPTIRAVG